MAYAAPAKTTFVAVFPAFSAVTDDQYAFWSGQAALIVDPIAGCLDARADLACMLISAHYLTLAGIGTGAESETAAQGMTGFKRIKSGTLELERGESSTSTESMGDWGATSYGQRVFPMLQVCLGGPRVTGTGSLPGCGFNGFAGPLPPWNC